jgi:hypothetical protein
MTAAVPLRPAPCRPARCGPARAPTGNEADPVNRNTDEIPSQVLPEVILSLQYLRGSNGVDAEQRVKLMKLL